MDKTKQFKVGDRVRCVAPFDRMTSLIGKTGTVVSNESFEDPLIGVRFDEPFEYGHTCDHKCLTGYGRYGYPFELELITTDEINIKMAFEEIFDDG